MPSILQKNRRNAGSRWIELTDPIRNISISEAKAIYDQARRFGSPRLQKIYDEIETADPILMTCVERRQSALAGLGWQVKVRASADPSLADEQRDAADAFLAGIENLTDALCHLDLAFFRGFAHVQPIWNGNAVRHVCLLDNWNFLQDDDGAWLWNPTCSITPSACEPVTKAARLITVCRRRPIDWPALTVYIRKALGERDWGRFLERYGIPPVDVVMAPQTTNDQEAKYLEAAEKARDGLPTAWPNGSDVSRAEGSRGQDPFSAFVEHQEKCIVLMATGGTLTSLAQADTGTLAGGAQMDVWREIVLRDSLVIADAVERSLVRPFVEAAFPGRPFAVSFELGVDRKLNSREAAELAGAIRSAGYIVDKAELEQATGFSLSREEAGSGNYELGMADGFSSVARPLARNSAASQPSTNNQQPTTNNPLLSAFKDDSSPLAAAIQDLLNDPSKEAAEALISRLPDLLPEDPALAAVLADEMAKQFTKWPTKNQL